MMLLFFFAVGGDVSGLLGAGLILQNNGTDDLAIGSNGDFIFPSQIENNKQYNISIVAEPTSPSQICSIANGAGTIGGVHVSNARVTCATATYTVGGTVSGLAGDSLIIQNAGGELLTITNDGPFQFSTPLADGSNYSVSNTKQPSGPSQACTIVNASGTMSGGDISDIAISCVTDEFSVGGTVTGLSGSGLVLQNNGENLNIGLDGYFSFPTAQLDGSAYNVSVSGQPTSPSQICSVANGAGTIGGVHATNVKVTCATATYTVGGTVSGLSGAGLIVQNAGGELLPLTNDGPFQFLAALADGSNYSISIADQPLGPSQACTILRGAGNMSGGNISDVAISCVTNAFSIGGTVTGLSGSGLVLQNNGGSNKNISLAGSFVFPNAQLDGSAYNVSILSQPTNPNQVCSIANGAGTVNNGHVSNVQITCENSIIACTDSSVDVRTVSTGFQCQTAFGAVFERVDRNDFGEAWLDHTSGLIWSDKLTTSGSHPMSSEMCGDRLARLPLKEDFQEAENRGFREVLPNLNRQYWTSSVHTIGANQLANLYWIFSSVHIPGQMWESPGYSAEVSRCVVLDLE